MADLLGVVVAGVQAFDYALQLCETIDRILNATGSRKRYQQTSQQLIGILQLIRASPHLQTPEILSCTKDLICAVDDVYSTLCRRRRSRFVASIVFVIKQKSYDDIFNYLEHQKATLALHISRLNADTLGELTATSNDIWIKIQSFYEKSLLDARIEAASPLFPSSTPWAPIPVATSDHQQEKFTDDLRSLDADIQASSQTNGHSSAVYKHFLKRYFSLARKEGSSSPNRGAEDVKEQMSVQMSDFSLGEEGEKEKVKVPVTRYIGGRETQQAHALDPSNTTTASDLEGNIQMADTFQIVGMEIGPNAGITDADLIRVTSGLSAHSNIHAGKGTQVIGQRVCAGARPRVFTGRYCNNIHRGEGDQVIGFSFE
ncbi:hypothetical protein HD806DRAFT_495554 [Xylariaceae sp. AK1471]|nr:hypothetical protein HD806DRAFT_495554 [Xylariaceae sp. AK1471]